MPIWVFAVVIASSFFQAWWNFHLKKTPIDRSAFLLVGWFLFGLIFTPISIIFMDKPFQWEWLYFIIPTGIAQGMYLLVLCWAYSVSDISLVFPVSRGAGLGLLSVALALLGKSSISYLGWIGIIAIMLGVMSLGSVDIKTARGRKGLLASLLIAVVVAFYSVVDSFGSQEIPIPFYVMIMNITGPLFAFPFVYRSRKADVLIAFQKYKLQGILVGLAGTAAYMIVVFMFRYSTPAYVLALREVSVVIATALGVVYLGESKSLRKYIGIAFILTGIICIKLA